MNREASAGSGCARWRRGTCGACLPTFFVFVRADEVEVEEEEAEAPPAKAPQDEGAQQVVVLAGLSGGHLSEWAAGREGRCEQKWDGCLSLGR